MIAFSCALCNIITGRHFVKYWVPGGGISIFCLFREKTEYARSASQEKLKWYITSCEAYSSLRENFLNYLECDPTSEIMKSTDNETVINYQNLSLHALRRDLNALNADSQ